MAKSNHNKYVSYPDWFGSSTSQPTQQQQVTQTIFYGSGGSSGSSEGAGLTGVVTQGSGNAVTSGMLDGATLVLNKDLTFVTDQSSTNAFWELREDLNGKPYLYANYDIVTLGGHTMYVDGDDTLNLPELYDGIPIDNVTIYWDTDENGNKVLKSVGTGSGGGGVADKIAWANVYGKPSWITNDKPIYDYSEIQNVPDLSGFVTIEGYQKVKGVKNFLNGIQIADLPITKLNGYEDVIYIDANVVVRGGLTMYSTGEADIPSLTDSIVTDGITILNDNGVLKINPEIQLGGITEEEMQAIVNLINTKWTTDNTKISHWDTAYSWGNHANAGYVAKQYVDDTFVTFKKDEIITGLKTFTKGIQIGIGDSKIKINQLQDDVLYIDSNVVIRGGLTMYYEDGDIDLPSIKEEIGNAGYDGTTGLASFNSKHFSISSDGIVSIIGGTGGLDIEQLESYLTSNKYVQQSYVDNAVSNINNRLNDFLTGSDTDTIINKWKELEAFLSGLSESDNLATILSTKWTTDNNLINKWNTAYGWGNHASVGYALKSYVDSNFVTLGTKQTITGEKNFTGGLKVNGSPIYYDAANKYWKLEGDLLVTGGVSMYSDDSEFIPSTIMDGVVVDGTSIRKNPTTGALEVIGGSGATVKYPLSWSGFNQGSYDGSVAQSFYIPTKLSEFVNDKSFATTSDLSGYLLKSSYTASDILTKLKDVDGSGSGLDADKLDGREASQFLWNQYSDYAQYHKVLTFTRQREKGSFTLSVWGSDNTASGRGCVFEIYWGYNTDTTADGVILIRCLYAFASNLSATTEEKLIAVRTSQYTFDLYFESGTGGLYAFQILGKTSRITINSFTPTPVDELPEATYTSKLGNVKINASNAARLTTARSLWGNAFDGTSDISGDLILPNNVRILGESTIGNPAILMYRNTSNNLIIGHGIAAVSNNTFIDGNSVYLRYSANHTQGFLLNSSGNVTIGSSDSASTNYRLYVSGKALITGDIKTNSTLDINGIKLSKSQDGVLYLDGNLVVKGGVTMYGTDESDVDSIIDSLPLASTTSKGIAQFSPTYFTVSNGVVSIIKDSVGLNTTELASYLATWKGSSKITTLGIITTGTWNGSKIANSYLANSSLTISGTSVSLGGSISQSALRTALGLGSNAYTSTSYLPSSSYTANDILTKLKTVDGYGSGLAADILGARDYNGGSETTTLTTSIKLYEASRTDDTQVRGIYDNGWRLYLRNVYIHDGTNSRTILHSGNIANYNAGSATKLATARTIWGQSFDGTGNVDGKLTITGADASSSQIEFTRDGYSYILGKALSLGTSTAGTDRLLVLTSGSATFQCDILPNTNNTHSMGAYSNYFKRIHANSITSGASGNSLWLSGGASSDNIGVVIARSSNGTTLTELMCFNANGIVFDSSQQGYIRVDEGKNIYLYKGVDSKSVMLGDGYFKPLSAANGALKLGNYNSTWNGLYLKANHINNSIMFCDTSGNGTTSFAGSSNGNAGIYTTGGVYLRPACTAGSSGTITNSGIGVEINTDGKVLPSNSVVLPNSVSYQGLTTDGTATNLAYISSSNNLIIGYGVAAISKDTYIDGYNIRFRYGSSHTQGMIMNASGYLGIGTNPSYKLHVDGNGYFSSTVYFGNSTSYYLGSSGNIYCYNLNTSGNANLNSNKLLMSSSNSYGTSSWSVYAYGPTMQFVESSQSDFCLKLNSDNSITINELHTIKGTGNRYVKLNSSGLRVYTTTTGGYVTGISLYKNSGDSLSAIISAYGTAESLSYIFIGGTYNAPYVKIDTSKNMLVGGGITMYSDIRKKTKLQDVELSLSQIANAPLIQHYYNSDKEKTPHVGSIAQYWAGLNDWFCKLDNEGYYTMEIQNCALASAISIARHLEKYESKTDKKIRMLKKRITELEDKLERLEGGNYGCR